MSAKAPLDEIELMHHDLPEGRNCLVCLALFGSSTSCCYMKITIYQLSFLSDMIYVIVSYPYHCGELQNRYFLRSCPVACCKHLRLRKGAAIV